MISSYGILNSAPHRLWPRKSDWAIISAFRAIPVTRFCTMQAAARSLGEDGLFLCQGICGNFSRFHTDPWITRYIFPNSMLPSLAQLTRAAEGVFIVEDVKNIGPNYDPTLLAWEENFRRAWPRFADQYGERFRRMWRFYLLSCAGAFRARSLQVFSILFSKEGAAKTGSPQRVRPVAATDEKETKLDAAFHATLGHSPNFPPKYLR